MTRLRDELAVGPEPPYMVATPQSHHADTVLARTFDCQQRRILAHCLPVRANLAEFSSKHRGQLARLLHIFNGKLTQQCSADLPKPTHSSSVLAVEGQHWAALSAAYNLQLLVWPEVAAGYA